MTNSIEEIDVLLRRKVQRWRGEPLIPRDRDGAGDMEEAANDTESGGDDEDREFENKDRQRVEDMVGGMSFLGLSENWP